MIETTSKSNIDPAAAPAGAHNRENDPHNVYAAFEEWMERLCREDVTPKEIGALYAPDAELFGTVSPTLCCTPEQVEAYFQCFLRGKSDLHISPAGGARIQVFGCGEERLALHSGHYTFSFLAGGQQHALPARYTFVYRWSGGRWIIVAHHSSALPAAPEDDY